MQKYFNTPQRNSKPKFKGFGLFCTSNLKLIKWLFFVTVGIALTFLGNSIYQKKIARELYVQDALKIIDELDKIKAGCDVGISYLEFSKMMISFNYCLLKFNDKYNDDVNVNQINSFKAIKLAGESYKLMLTYWGSEINIQPNYIGNYSALVNNFQEKTKRIVKEIYTLAAQFAISYLDIAKETISNADQEKNSQMAQKISFLNKIIQTRLENKHKEINAAAATTTSYIKDERDATLAAFEEQKRKDEEFFHLEQQNKKQQAVLEKQLELQLEEINKPLRR